MYTSTGNEAPINYLSRVNCSRLGLIQGDYETFSDVLSLINDYEGKQALLDTRQRCRARDEPESTSRVTWLTVQQES